jgi:hypothetical protein
MLRSPVSDSTTQKCPVNQDTELSVLAESRTATPLHTRFSSPVRSFAIALPGLMGVGSSAVTVSLPGIGWC